MEDKVDEKTVNIQQTKTVLLTLNEEFSSQIRKSKNIKQIHTFSNLKILFGLLAIFTAALCYKYIFSWPAEKNQQRVLCCVIFFIFTLSSEFIIRFIEKDSFLFVSLKNNQKYFIKGIMKKYSDEYTLKFWHKNKKIMYNFKVTDFFDKIPERRQRYKINKEKISKQIKTILIELGKDE
eukprot:TRINITY_DN1434_c0_g1_i1.p1 TRINITY_DN1434_c0_g1~~TRINITY_DN1434_c0_g1_i1.p1  ORF type:complete len:179 (+),score=31.99 TRINITY_DN1434_c0_g1_i1:59-595(+)